MYLTIDINRIIHRFIQQVMISLNPTVIQRKIYTVSKTKVRRKNDFKIWKMHL